MNTVIDALQKLNFENKLPPPTPEEIEAIEIVRDQREGNKEKSFYFLVNKMEYCFYPKCSVTTMFVKLGKRYKRGGRLCPVLNQSRRMMVNLNFNLKATSLKQILHAICKQWTAAELTLVHSSQKCRLAGHWKKLQHLVQLNPTHKCVDIHYLELLFDTLSKDECPCLDFIHKYHSDVLKLL